MLFFRILFIFTLLVTPSLYAQQSSDVVTPVEAAPPVAPASPYHLPWQLRNAMSESMLRLDPTLAFFTDGGTQDGRTLAWMVLGSHKVTDSFALAARFAVIENWPPRGQSGTSVVNPIISGTYSWQLPHDLRLAAFLGLALPMGMGGGDGSNPRNIATTGAGFLARSSFDNPMFAVNDFVFMPGVDLAWIAHGVTAQFEMTLNEYLRTRGKSLQSESHKTDLNIGAHVGYFILPTFSAGAELRYQVWLVEPGAVSNVQSSRDTLSVAVGLRWHHKFSNGTAFMPGVAYSRGIDTPMSRRDYNILQIDLPFVF
jgi:hypothetical protein